MNFNQWYIFHLVQWVQLHSWSSAKIEINGNLLPTNITCQPSLYNFWRVFGRKYFSWSGLSRPGVFLLVTNLSVTILKTKPYGSFSTSLIKFFQHWSRLFLIPCLKAPFAVFHAPAAEHPPLTRWISTVLEGIHDVGQSFINYISCIFIKWLECLDKIKIRSFSRGEKWLTNLKNLYWFLRYVKAIL